MTLIFEVFLLANMDEVQTYQQRLLVIARKYLRDQWLSETTPPPVLLTPDNFGTCPQLQDEADENTAQLGEGSRKGGRHVLKAAADKDTQVLGMVTVQVEKDPKTGATVVRSVAPMSTPADAPNITTVFDDGRKSIHAVGGTGCQPSSEELGQILSVIDGVGMTALLDEVTVVPNSDTEMKIEHVEVSRTPEEKVVSSPSHHAMSKEEDMQLDSTRSYDLEAELSAEDLERVIITEDGEEHVLGPETPDSPPSTLDQEAEEEAGKESIDEVFQDVPLNGNGTRVKVQDQEVDNELHKSSSPSTEVGEDTPKRKTCQCCSV
ncbi:hypothetical protein INR49_028975, partial [Caranx melampygus]